VTTRPNPAGSASARLVAGGSDVSLGQWRGPNFYWVRMGSSPEADWRVEAEGVAPMHCELLWDGTGLFVHDPLRLGCTYIESQRVDTWSPLKGSHLLRMGAAAIWIQAPVQPSEKPLASALRWVQAEQQRLRESGPPARDRTPRWATLAKKLLVTCMGMGAASGLDRWT